MTMTPSRLQPAPSTKRTASELVEFDALTASTLPTGGLAFTVAPAFELRSQGSDRFTLALFTCEDFSCAPQQNPAPARKPARIAYCSLQSAHRPPRACLAAPCKFILGSSACGAEGCCRPCSEGVCVKLSKTSWSFVA